MGRVRENQEVGAGHREPAVCEHERQQSHLSLLGPPSQPHIQRTFSSKERDPDNEGPGSTAYKVCEGLGLRNWQERQEKKDESCLQMFEISCVKHRAHSVVEGGRAAPGGRWLPECLSLSSTVEGGSARRPREDGDAGDSESLLSAHC